MTTSQDATNCRRPRRNPSGSISSCQGAPLEVSMQPQLRVWRRATRILPENPVSTDRHPYDQPNPTAESRWCGLIPDGGATRGIPIVTSGAIPGKQIPCAEVDRGSVRQDLCRGY